ncbi:tetratricopeptide repeat protein [uncultured Flavobacterium sp.]|uniref:tetratricopeptide repeat protein n=1 Tax=uncultured Flavobacterium sp. TaxID=165435 RepID=UPI0025D6EB55|nr:tetratricopeptide repeat protein [uncultured Flavobacterium sp.]
MKKYLYISLSLGMFCVSMPAFAQKEPDDIALAEDAFQDNFYESLKQKGIENYDKAILSLEKCLKTQPENAAVYSELGKNYLQLKDYKKAYDSFEKASKIDPLNKWFFVGMYDVCYQTRDYNHAIIIVTKLIEFDANYKEDLTSLYMYTDQFDKALALINELDETVGKNPQREVYKLQIMKDAKYQLAEKDQLLNAIKKNPKDESKYTALIYLYSESNQEEKAFEIAKKLEKEIPDSDFAQIGLFKFHLNNNDGQKAVISMNKVFESKQITSKVKAKILQEFLIFLKTNPKYGSELDKSINLLPNEDQVGLTKEAGRVFYGQKNWERAIYYLEIYSKNNPQEVETSILLMQAYTENKQFDVLSKKANTMIDFFPIQPEFYYYSGLASNQLKNYKKAKEMLEMGMDYLVENRDLEINFNIQLGEAYNGLGDSKKKEQYFTKAEQLLKQKK